VQSRCKYRWLASVIRSGFSCSPDSTSRSERVDDELQRLVEFAHAAHADRGCQGLAATGEADALGALVGRIAHALDHADGDQVIDQLTHGLLGEAHARDEVGEPDTVDSRWRACTLLPSW